jgi:hypothetical protein
MESTCEVVGWLLDDSEHTQVLIRETNGELSLQTADLGSTFGQRAVQTGAFRRGNPIIDPVTRQMIGYEMERIPKPLVEAASR